MELWPWRCRHRHGRHPNGLLPVCVFHISCGLTRLDGRQCVDGAQALGWLKRSICWLPQRPHQAPLGPRIPWLLYGALPLGIFIAASWWNPPGGIWIKFAVLVVIASCTQVAYTCVNLPYSALAAELTPDIDLRTRLNAARFTGSIVAGLSGVVIAALVGVQVNECNGGAGLNGDAFLVMGLITGVVVAAGTFACGWGLKPFAKHCQQPSGKPEPIKQQLLRICRNGRFLKVLGLYLLLWCALQLMQTVALLYLNVLMQVPRAGAPGFWCHFKSVPWWACSCGAG